MPFQRRNIKLTLLLVLLLSGGGVVMYSLWKENQRHKQDQAALTEQLRQATESQKEATITRRISTQLEEIAYQQKEISDIQKQEAVNQTKIAQEMREHAELERERAVVAQEAALEAYNQMEEQKKLAETRREEAVKAQLKADTLARLALGRSLGSQASTQYTIGNKDLATLLSYSAWKFTSENKGDVHQPAIFDALSQTSDLSKHWRLHTGAIRDIQIFQDSEGQHLLSACQYGELYFWKIKGNDLSSGYPLVKNPVYDFRKVLVDKEHAQYIALSYPDKLVIVDKTKRPQEIPLETMEPVSMEQIGNDLFIAYKNGEIQKTRINEWKMTAVYKHPRRITAFGQNEKGLLVGDEKGGVYLLDTRGNASLLWDQLKQAITHLQAGKQAGMLAMGYKNGVIVIGNTTNGVYKELAGHISPVTDLRFSDNKLFSSSYDGTVRLWNIDNENRIVSSIVYQPSEWIHTFVIGEHGEWIYTGDEKGNLSLVPIAPDYMAAQIKQRLSRNLTREEWNYYIGELSEYETYK
ncbi:hypothetical protein [Parabacteroides sp.]